MSKQFEKYVEVRRVTEFKDGCVFKTVHVGHRWVDMDAVYYAAQTNGTIYCSVSGDHQTIRVKK